MLIFLTSFGLFVGLLAVLYHIGGKPDWDIEE